MALDCLSLSRYISPCIKFGLAATIVSTCLTYFTLCGRRGSAIEKSFDLLLSPGNTRCMLPPETPKPSIKHGTDRVIYKSQGLDLQMHSVYLDDRHNETFLRFFGLQKKDKVKISFMCQWVTIENGVHITKVVSAKRILVDPSWPTWTPQYAVNFDCKIPNGVRPRTATLMSIDQKHSYTLPVVYSQPEVERKTLAVCVKPITGHFSVPKLVEWFELIRLSGVDKIILYNTDIFGTARYVLEYYEQIGVAKVMSFPFLLAVLQVTDNPPVKDDERYGIYQQTYLVAMHECLYKFRNQYEFLLFIDLDEVLLPVRHSSLINMMKDIKSTYKNGAGFLFPTAWHFEEHGEMRDRGVPGYLYMQRFARASLPGQVQPKSIISTDRAITLNFHSLLDVPRHHFSNEEMSAERYAYVHHYRGRCDKKFEKFRCKELLANPRVDPVIVRYRDDIIHNVDKVLDYLQLK